MKRFAAGLLFLLAIAPLSWADDNKNQMESPEPREARVGDLPRPIPELLEKLQHLSQNIEPEITRLGSKLGQELEETVKKLREELQSTRRRDSE